MIKLDNLIIRTIRIWKVVPSQEQQLRDKYKQASKLKLIFYCNIFKSHKHWKNGTVPRGLPAYSNEMPVSFETKWRASMFGQILSGSDKTVVFQLFNFLSHQVNRQYVFTLYCISGLKDGSWHWTGSFMTGIRSLPPGHSNVRSLSSWWYKKNYHVKYSTYFDVQTIYWIKPYLGVTKSKSWWEKHWCVRALGKFFRSGERPFFWFYDGGRSIVLQ